MSLCWCQWIVGSLVVPVGSAARGLRTGHRESVLAPDGQLLEDELRGGQIAHLRHPVCCD